MKLYLYIILFTFLSEPTNAQIIPYDSLFKLVTSANYIDSAEKLIIESDKETKEKLFTDLRKYLLQESGKISGADYIICYFKLFPSKENLHFLFENLYLGLSIDLSLSQCRVMDILGFYGKPTRKIAIQKSIEAVGFKEFFSYTLLVFSTKNWSLSKKLNT